MIKRIVLFATVIFLFILTFVFLFFNSYRIDKRKKVTFWTIQLKPIYQKQIENIIEKFEYKYPDYKIVWVDIPIQEAQKRTLASVLSSTPPDLINLNPDFSYILAQKNILEYFSDDELWQFHQGLIDKLKYNGKVYALPFYATSPVTIYNKKFYKKYTEGEFPKSYDELYSISNKLYKTTKIPVFASSLNENDTLYRILNKYDIYNLNGAIERNNTLKIYSMFNNMYKKGYMPKDTLTINHREVIEKYMSNQALSIVAGSNFIKMIKQNAPDVYKESVISPQLVGKNGKYDVSLMNLVIPKKAKNKQLALELAFELTSRENQLELAKLTNVLPANKYALSDDYFKNCPEDIEQMSRCVSVKQLNNLIKDKANNTDKKYVSEVLNKTLEEVLLDENSCSKTIEARIDNLFAHMNQ